MTADPIIRVTVEDPADTVRVRVLEAGGDGPRGPQGDVGPPGTTDHHDLENLGGDDHPQYLTPARGDLRYDDLGDATSALTSAMAYTDTALAGVVPMSSLNAPNGVATLDATGLIPSGQLPQMVFTRVRVVADQAAMLALPGAVEGDVAIRADDGSWWVLGPGDPTLLASWHEQIMPGVVTSVNGHAGPAVNLTAADVGALTQAQGDGRYDPLGAAGVVQGVLQSQIDANGAAIGANATAIGLRALDADVVHKVGGDMITASAGGVVPLILQGAPSPTVDLQQWQASTGTVIARVKSNGGFESTGAVTNAFGGAAISGAILGVSTGAAGNKGLVVKGAGSQTADLQQWQTSAGAVVAKMTASGMLATSDRVNFGSTTTDSGATVGALARSASEIALRVRGAASQTGDLQQWQDSAGTALSAVNASGGIAAAYLYDKALTVNSQDRWHVAPVPYGASQAGGIRMSATGGQFATRLALKSNAGGVARLALDGPGDTTGALGPEGLSVSSAGRVVVGGYSAATEIPLVVSGVAAQSNNLQEWRDSAATTLALVSAAGAIRTAGAGTFGTAGPYSGQGQLGVVAPASITIGATVRGAASQTANLQEWQNSAGTVLACVNASGGIITKNGLIVSPDASFASGATTTLRPGTAGLIGAVVKAQASQTANLQEWQDSAGAVLANITAGGSLYTGGRMMVGPDYSAQAQVTTASASRVATIIRAAVSQTADLTQWQVSSGATQAGVTAAGYGYFGSGYPGGHFGIATTAVGNRGIVVKGIVGQTAALQEFQDSTSAVLASVTALGRHKWSAVNEQATVGAAGAAAAHPATPTRYLRVVGSDGTDLVVPAYAAA